MKNQLTKRIIYTAILSAISCLLYIFLKFPLPFIFPSFLDIQFSNLPVIIAGFAFGPIEAVLVVIVRFLIKLPMSSTAMVGETADLLIGLMVAITTSVIYKKVHTKKGGIIALVIGSAVWVVGAALVNRFILLPWYAETYGINAIVGMLKSLFPTITADNYLTYYVFFSAIPFNLLLSVLVSVITIIVYKRISFLFKGIESSVKDHSGEFIGWSLIILDLVLLIGNLLFKKSAFIVSAKNSAISVAFTIIAYVIIYLLGVFIICLSKYHQKEAAN